MVEGYERNEKVVVVSRRKESWGNFGAGEMEILVESGDACVQASRD